MELVIDKPSWNRHKASRNQE